MAGGQLDESPALGMEHRRRQDDESLPMSPLYGVEDARETFSVTSSAASRGWRPRSPSAHRYSMWMFWLSAQPRSASPRRNESTKVVPAVGFELLMNPIPYTLPTGCASTANGAATRVTVPAMKARLSTIG
jgi:hypothetical protein